MNTGKLEDILDELSMTVAVVEVTQAAFAGKQDISEDSAAQALYLVWSKQHMLLESMREIVQAEGNNE